MTSDSHPDPKSVDDGPVSGQGSAEPSGPAPDDPFPTRLLAYAQERYPPGPMTTIGVLTVASTSLASAVVLGQGAATFDLGIALLAAVYVLTLFFLRVLDEFKDYERDVVAYPDRVLSRGVVTLAELRRVGWGLAVALPLGALALGPTSFVGYAVVFVYALLMAKEFFVGDVLGKDVFVYAAVHQPINLVITGWLYVTYASRTGAEELWQPQLGWFAAALFAYGFGFEVSRKLWTPAEEQPELVDSYSAHAVGPRGAASIALALLLGGLGCLAVFVVRTDLPVWTHAFIGLSALLCLASVGRFAAAPFPEASKKLQDATGLGALLVHVGLIAGILAAKGAGLVLWSGGWT